MTAGNQSMYADCTLCHGRPPVPLDVLREFSSQVGPSRAPTATAGLSSSANERRPRFSTLPLCHFAASSSSAPPRPPIDNSLFCPHTAPTTADRDHNCRHQIAPEQSNPGRISAFRGESIRHLREYFRSYTRAIRTLAPPSHSSPRQPATPAQSPDRESSIKNPDCHAD